MHGISLRPMIPLIQGITMTSLTITITDEHMLQLKAIADRFKIRPEDLARVGIEELLSQPDELFQKAARQVIERNAELNRRLA